MLHNQDKLRAEQYCGLQDALAQARASSTGTELEKIEQMVVLPAPFVGSPRFMYKHYLDALAIAQKYGKFDLFITMTMNPKLEAVAKNLQFTGMTAADRADIVNRVFQHMLTDLISDIKLGVLGER